MSHIIRMISFPVMYSKCLLDLSIKPCYRLTKEFNQSLDIVSIMVHIVDRLNFILDSRAKMAGMVHQVKITPRSLFLDKSSTKLYRKVKIKYGNSYLLVVFIQFTLFSYLMFIIKLFCLGVPENCTQNYSPFSYRLVSLSSITYPTKRCLYVLYALGSGKM